MQHEDEMKTFFLVSFFLLLFVQLRNRFGVYLQSETLKYLFLLFSDGDTISLSSELKRTFVSPAERA